jgi:hypothetical protein
MPESGYNMCKLYSALLQRRRLRNETLMFPEGKPRALSERKI